MKFKKKNDPKSPKESNPEDLKIRLDSLETESVKEQLAKIQQAKDKK